MSYDTFKRGYRFMCFDLLENCPDGAACGEEMLMQGFMDVSIQLGAALEDNCIMTVFAEVPESVEINHDRVARHIRAIM